MSNPPGTLMRHESYTVAVICAIGFEMSAVRYMLDREHPRLPPKQGDSNLYVLGELSGHNVVLACLPGTQGKGAAATVATNMARTFPSIEWRFLVGIGGGVPSDKHDIRLGDVVVSMPEGQYGGVIQYDLGKDTEDDFRLKGFLWQPPAMLRSAVEMMQSDHLMADSKVEEFLVQMLQRGPKLSIYQRPNNEPDVLFHADYPHVGSGSACEHCDQTKTTHRLPRQLLGPEVHYGLIASGDRVMRSAVKRNASTRNLGDILCFEMEAAGIATEFPCIVIRGISDYADSHKNDSWQRYAAAAAAASAKELLSYIGVNITPEPSVGDATSAFSDQGALPRGNGEVSQQLSGQGIIGYGPVSVGRDVHFATYNQIMASQPLRRTSTHSSTRSLSEVEKACVKLLHQNGHMDQDDDKLKPLPGTCQWIRSHELFVSFLAKGSNALLWLTGHPGCGKTMLAFSLCEYLEEHYANEKSLNVLVYFCSNKYSKQTDAREVLAGLIFQIVNRHRSMISHVRRVFEVQGQSMIESFSSLWNIFLRIAKDPKAGKLYIILDALDECENKSCKRLVGAISEMLTEPVRSNTQVKFMITSRPFLHETYARSNRVLQPQISIDGGQTGYVADLEKFIQQRVEEISINRQYPSHVREYLLETMRAKADRTFLWIHMVLASVEESLLTSISDFRNIISSIPDELAETYKRYLSAISPNHQDQAAYFIKLLLASSRPLELDELNIAFTLRESHSTTEDVELDAQTAFSHTIQGILGPLVRVHGSQISLVHQSLKEFLLETAAKPGSFCATQTVNTKASALQMASACIQYLRLVDFRDDLFCTGNIPDLHDDLPVGDFGGAFWDDGPDLGSDVLFHDPDILNPKICDSLISKYAFYSYASLHWAEHFALCGESASDRLRDAATQLLDVGKGSSRNWLQFHRTQAANFLDTGFVDQHPLVLATYFNLQTAVEHLLGSVDTPQTIKNRGLFWASRLGHGRVVATLLRAGAEPNSREVQQQSALTAASEHGHLECVKTLLADERTDINGGGRRGRSGVSFACGNGHESIVRELLDRKDCKVDHLDNSGATPLFWAVGGGHLAIISTLKRHPTVNINHQDKDGRTAISWAAGDGMDEALKLLLKIPGIDVNLRDRKGKSPLSWASGNGCAITVAILLNSPAVDILSIDKTGRNAISWASGGGHNNCLVNLLDKGKVGADTEDTAGWTPLAWAIQKDSPETVQTLIIDGGVEIDRTDRGGRTALSWAVEYGHAPVVQVLLQNGANSKSKRGGSLIRTATSFGRDDLVEMLVKCGIE